MNRLFVATTAWLSVSMMITTVFGQARPCQEDIVNFCSNVPIGEGRISKCLKQHAGQLTPACTLNLVQVKEALKEGIRLAKTISQCSVGESGPVKGGP